MGENDESRARAPQPKCLSNSETLDGPTAGLSRGCRATKNLQYALYLFRGLLCRRTNLVSWMTGQGLDAGLLRLPFVYNEFLLYPVKISLDQPKNMRHMGNSNIGVDSENPGRVLC